MLNGDIFHDFGQEEWYYVKKKYKRCMLRMNCPLLTDMYITVKMYPCSGGTDTGSPEL